MCTNWPGLVEYSLTDMYLRKRQEGSVQQDVLCAKKLDSFASCGGLVCKISNFTVSVSVYVHFLSPICTV